MKSSRIIKKLRQDYIDKNINLKKNIQNDAYESNKENEGINNLITEMNFKNGKNAITLKASRKETFVGSYVSTDSNLFKNNIYHSKINTGDLKNYIIKKPISNRCIYNRNLSGLSCNNLLTKIDEENQYFKLEAQPSNYQSTLNNININNNINNYSNNINYTTSNINITNFTNNTYFTNDISKTNYETIIKNEFSSNKNIYINKNNSNRGLISKYEVNNNHKIYRKSFSKHIENSITLPNNMATSKTIYIQKKDKSSGNLKYEPNRIMINKRKSYICKPNYYIKNIKDENFIKNDRTNINEIYHDNQNDQDNQDKEANECITKPNCNQNSKSHKFNFIKNNYKTIQTLQNNLESREPNQIENVKNNSLKKSLFKYKSLIYKNKIQNKTQNKNNEKDDNSNNCNDGDIKKYEEGIKPKLENVGLKKQNSVKCNLNIKIDTRIPSLIQKINSKRNLIENKSLFNLKGIKEKKTSKFLESNKNVIDDIDVDYANNNDEIQDEYLNEIFTNLLEEEKNSDIKISQNYFSSQTEITPKMRYILYDWLIEVNLNFNFNDETLFLAFYIIDSYLSLVKIPKSKYQLLGISALLIASKYNEIIFRRIKEFAKITNNSYTKKEIEDMENNIVNILDFNFTIPTPLRFFEIISKILGFREDTQKFNLGLFLMQLFMLSEKSLYFNYSAIACAAGYIVMKYFKISGYQKCYDGSMFNEKEGSQEYISQNQTYLNIIKEASKLICDEIRILSLNNCYVVRKFRRSRYNYVSELMKNF